MTRENLFVVAVCAVTCAVVFVIGYLTEMNMRLVLVTILCAPLIFLGNEYMYRTRQKLGRGSLFAVLLMTIAIGVMVFAQASISGGIIWREEDKYIGLGMLFALLFGIPHTIILRRQHKKFFTDIVGNITRRKR